MPYEPYPFPKKLSGCYAYQSPELPEYYPDYECLQPASYTNHTILNISVMTGFSTLSNFNRHFNEMMKVSPKEYRKQTLQGRKPGEVPSIIEYSGWMEPD